MLYENECYRSLDTVIGKNREKSSIVASSVERYTTKDNEHHFISKSKRIYCSVKFRTLGVDKESLQKNCHMQTNSRTE